MVYHREMDNTNIVSLVSLVVIVVHPFSPLAICRLYTDFLLISLLYSTLLWTLDSCCFYCVVFTVRLCRVLFELPRPTNKTHCTKPNQNTSCVQARAHKHTYTHAHTTRTVRHAICHTQDAQKKFGLGAAAGHSLKTSMHKRVCMLSVPQNCRRVNRRCEVE